MALLFLLTTVLTKSGQINVNPAGGGGGGAEFGQGAGIWLILNFSDQIPQGRKRKVNQKCQKSPTQEEKI